MTSETENKNGSVNYALLAIDELLIGTSGGDKLFGGDGNDTLVGGGLADLLTGGTGADVFRFVLPQDSQLPFDSDRIADFEDGIDLIDLSGLGFHHITTNTTTLDGELRLEYSGGLTYLRSDQVDFGLRLNGNLLDELTNEDFLLDGAVDPVTIVGSGATETLVGGAGNDQIFGGGGSDLIVGAGGDDTLIGGTGHETFNGGEGADVINGDGGGGTVSYANDTVGVQVDLSDAGPQSGGEAEGDVLSNINGVIGGSGNDELFGNGANTTIHGGDGDDTIDGGDYADLLTGGDGADVFHFSSLSDSAFPNDSDRITDFEDGLDMIDVSGLGFTSITTDTVTNAGELRVELVGNITYVLNDQNDFGFRLNGDHTAALTDADFIF